MANKKRKTGKAKPITSHQLFPAVVALWFGALFGLGSLAIRPSLIEQAVIASKIDLVIPAAAPPLGVTARILIALVLSALGAAIGAALARRIARPKQEVRQRKRSATNLDVQPAVSNLNASVIDPPMRQPISAHEELGADSFDSAEPQVSLGGRRRALAIDHDEGEFVPYDTAPLPGGHLQILDVGGNEFGAAAAKSQAEPLDLGEFSPPQPFATEPSPAPTPAEAPAQTAPVQLDWSQARPILPAETGLEPVTAPLFAAPAQAATATRQVFQPMEVEPGDSAIGDTSSAAGAPAFTAAPAATIPEAPFAGPNPDTINEPRQIFGMPVEDGAVPRDAVRAAGYQVSVFDTPEPSPLFDRSSTVQSAPVAVAAPLTEPAEPLPSPASLDMTDLAARLAESMQRRRAARSAAQPVAPVQVEEPAEVPSVPVAFEPEATEIEPAPFAPTIEAVAEAPQEPGESAFAPAIARFDPFANLPPIVIPEQMPEQIEAASPLAVASAPAVEALPIAPPPAPLAMPAALRPLPIDDAQIDDEPLDSLLPPRRFASPALQPEPAAPTLAVAPAALEPAETEIEAPVEDAVVPEENYGSLLELGRLTPSNPFVRIEEPKADLQAVEPVVIFPGQASRPAPIPAQFAPPAAQAAPFAAPAAPEGTSGEVASFRRFDAPAQAGQGQPVAAAPATGPALDPAETELALRSALANLQRMSGAA